VRAPNVRGRPLRVAHLDTGRDWRGGQAQVAMLMEGLKERGVSSFLLAPPGPLLARARSIDVPHAAWSPRADWDLVALARARSILSREKPDVVHCHTARAHAVGVPAARLARASAVIVSRRVAVAVGRNPLSALKYRMPVDRYLCVSKGVMAAMRAAGIDEERLALVPSGVPIGSPPEPAAPTLRERIGAPADAPVVGTLAALTAEKRHEDLLDAAALVAEAVPDVRFAWIGDGPRRKRLEQLRAERGLEARVFLLGFREDARALLAQCTAVALASELEGIATSLIEAQAAGVPVVATAVGGIPEVIQEGVTGRLVPPRDPAALAAAIIDTLRDPAGARLRAARARDSVVQFDIARTVERTVAEYERVLGAASRPA
jgi:glycosyltransferase involved in cell wall biosynthesis